MFGVDDLAIGLGLASGVQKLLGNEFASDEATAARDWSAQENLRNREWQQMMRGTQYQTAVEDMKKAGLNPMLAYHQGGAGTPGGSSGGGASASPSNTGGPDLTTAVQVENIRAQTAKIRQETQNLADENPNIRGIKGIQDQTVALLREQAAQTESYRYLNDEQRKLVNEQIKNAVEQRANIKADTRDTIANAVLRELDYNRARNEAAAQFKYQDYFENVAPFTGELGKLVHSAKEARDAFRKTPAWRRK